MPRADANRRRCAIYTRKSSKTASSASRNNSPASSRRLFGSKQGLRPLDPQQRGVPSDSEQRAPGIARALSAPVAHCGPPTAIGGIIAALSRRMP